MLLELTFKDGNTEAAYNLGVQMIGGKNIQQNIEKGMYFVRAFIEKSKSTKYLTSACFLYGYYKICQMAKAISKKASKL